MAIHPSARFYERNRGQLPAPDVLIELVGVEDVRRSNSRVSHDLRLVLESVADIAVLIALLPDRSVVLLIFVGEIGIPLIVVALPRNVVLQHHIRDTALRSWRNRERSVVGICVGVGVAPITRLGSSYLKMQAWERPNTCSVAEVATLL